MGKKQALRAENNDLRIEVDRQRAGNRDVIAMLETRDRTISELQDQVDAAQAERLEARNRAEYAEGMLSHIATIVGPPRSLMGLAAHDVHMMLLGQITSVRAALATPTQ